MQPLLVTAAIIRDGERILLTKRPEGSRHAGMWEFPGGKLNDGETPQECLRREIQEELDLAVEVGDIFEVATYRYEWGAVLILAFLCRSRGGVPKNIEVAEHRWVLPAELDDFDILPADKPIIERLQQGKESL